MKTLIYLLLASACLGAPTWVERGGPVPHGLVRVKLDSPTQSMAPVMTGKEVCYFEPYTGQPISLGDVVWFVRSDGEQVLHRVTSKNKRAVYTSGDANRHSDGWIPLAKVRFILRYVERPEVSYLAQVR